MPSSFGSDPLAQLPCAEGSMLVRTASDVLMLAATVLDAGDSTSPLPAYADAKLYCGWLHPGELNWDCRLSAQRLPWRQAAFTGTSTAGRQNLSAFICHAQGKAGYLSSAGVVFPAQL